MTDRVMIFIDYQNVYHGARDFFHPEPDPPSIAGQAHPILLGAHIASDRPFDRQLTSVRVYRGFPSVNRDRRASAAFRR